MDNGFSDSYLHPGDAELAPQSPSGEYSINVETADYTENIGVNVGDEQQAVYHLTPSLVIRAHSCGDQDVPRPFSGPRRRTQSDRTDISMRMSSAQLSSTFDSSAVDDEYSSDALPEITFPPGERTTLPSVGIYIPPQSRQHMVPSPGLLSPGDWPYSAGSETSSVGSSSSPSAYHARISSIDGFTGPAGYDRGSPDPNQLWHGDAIEHQYPEPDVLRGRSMQRRKHSDSNTDSSTVASLVESLSIAEGTSIEHAQPNYDLSHQQPEVQYPAFSGQDTGYIYSIGSQAYALQENPSPYSEPPVSNEASFHTSGLRPSPTSLGYSFGYFRHPHSPSSDTGSSNRSSSRHSFTPSAQGNADEAFRDARHREEYMTSLNTTVSQGGVQRTPHRQRERSPYLPSTSQGRDTDREWVEHQRGDSSSSASRDDGLARLHPPPSSLGTDVFGHAQRQHEHGSFSLPDPSWVHQRGESSSSLDFQISHLARSHSLSSISTSGGGLADALGDQPGALPQGTSSKEKQDAKKFRSVGSAAGRRAAKNRRKDQTMPGAFVCEVCGADFTAKHNLRNHMNSHGSVKEFRCDTCGQSFGTSHVLKRHEGKCLTTTFPQGSF